MLDKYPNLKKYIYGEESFKQLFVYDERQEHIMVFRAIWPA